MPILYTGIGFLILLAGRPAYAIFTGGLGLLLGVFLSTHLYAVPSNWNILALPLLFAAFGALMAFIFKRWTVRVAGFFVGGFLATNLPIALGATDVGVSWMLYVIVGVISVLFLFLLFDIALTLLSCLFGISLILQNLSFGALDNVTMFIVLMAFGLIAQFLLLNYGNPSPD
jgi:hypothetical protein